MEEQDQDSRERQIQETKDEEDASQKENQEENPNPAQQQTEVQGAPTISNSNKAAQRVTQLPSVERNNSYGQSANLRSHAKAIEARSPTTERRMHRFTQSTANRANNPLGSAKEQPNPP